MGRPALPEEIPGVPGDQPSCSDPLPRFLPDIRCTPNGTNFRSQSAVESKPAETSSANGLDNRAEERQLRRFR